MNTNSYLIPVIKNKNKFFINYQGRSYDLSPSIATQMNMSPNIMGVDKIIAEAIKIKKINTNNFNLNVSLDYFLKCDISMAFDKKLYNGWVYITKPESLSFYNEQKVWVCPYLKIFYKEPPRELFLKIDL